MKNRNNKILEKINQTSPEIPFKVIVWFIVSTIIIALSIELAMRTPLGG